MAHPDRVQKTRLRDACEFGPTPADGWRWASSLFENGVEMHQNDVLIQASTAGDVDAWHVVHRSAGSIGPQAWAKALSVARQIARREQVDIYRAQAGSGPTLHETYHS